MTNFTHTSSEHLSERPPVRSLGARVLLAAVDLYQRLRVGRVAPCRFYPSCSEYAKEALESHGAARGGWLAVRRVLRCRPLGPHGVDLVPEPKKVRNSRPCTR
jgi:putative membrane protein insertion efficiency factor